MRAEASWKPSKFVEARGRWRANPAQVAPRSRLITDIVAMAYAELIERYAKGRLLELGAGQAPLFGMYRTHVQEAICVDWGHSLHDETHLDHLCDLNSPPQGDEPWLAEPFDTVISTDVIEHLRRPGHLFRHASAALRPGGVMLLGTPFLYWIHEAPHDYGRLTRYALEALAEEEGLEVLQIAPYGGALEVLADLAGKTLRLPDPLALAGYRAVSFLLSLPPAAALRHKTEQTMPLGYTMAARKPERP